MTEFKDLLGKTLTRIEGLYEGSGFVTFECTDGTSYQLYHEQDCCESVYVEDVVGRPEDLLGTPLLLADEAVGPDLPPAGDPAYADSYTWTFYKLGTVKGYVDLRWYGESNGYYSEAVSFREVAP